MVKRDDPSTPPSAPDGDGVRTIAKARTAGRSALAWGLAVVAVVGVVAAWRQPAPAAPARPAADPLVSEAAPSTPAAATPHPTAPLPAQSRARSPSARPHADPNDLASHFQPGDPEPTGPELIGAMHEAGVRTGIGAFNPPGTSPPLEGLAVPDDYALPEGYVRHHQSTDEGVPIEPILMFAPGFTLYDSSGRPIAMPEDRVVPAALAPPGLPLRRVRIPPP